MSGEEPKRIVVPHVTRLSQAGTERAIVELSNEATAVELLGAADITIHSSVVMLTAMIERLDRRKRDIEELHTIARTAHELTRKIERLGNRLLGELEEKTGE